MSLIQGNAKSSGAGGFYSTTIDGSLRFNDNDSAYLSRTPASAGNRKTWTWSGWVKRGNLGYRTIFSTGASPIGTTNNNLTQLYFDSNNYLRFFVYSGGTTNASFVTSQVFRDTSAWYHIVVLVDTTQATSSDRVKIYINGSQITAFSTSTYPSQNFDGYVNQNVPHVLGVYAGNGGGNHLDGYLAEVNFIDGTALDATSFGEFKSGVWIPKEYSGSYGTNGFYLPLTSDANDDSGNGNDFTANNLASTDYVLDSPTNNFATMNPLYRATGTYNELKEGNLVVDATTSTWRWSSANWTISSGKWYWEMQGQGSADGDVITGIMPEADVNLDANAALGWDSPVQGAWTYERGYIKHNSTNYASGLSGYTQGDIFGFALDADSGTLKFYKNNSLLYTATIDMSNAWVPSCATINTTYNCYNFGQDSSFAGYATAQGNTDANGIGDFYYAPPSGYLALCTANLPDPVASIDPAQDGSPQDHFNTVLYTGNGSTQSITGVGFQPDFTWLKSRSHGTYHLLYDAIRGAGNQMYTNSTGAEGYDSTTLTSFDSDGFSLGADTGSGANISGYTQVAWNWKANGSGVSNTDGSITSTVSANTDAGFSIVAHTGDGIDEATIGHGLSQAPDVIITKGRTNTRDWRVYHKDLPTDYALLLNQTVAQSGTFSNGWIHNVTSTTFAANNYSGIAGVNSSGVDYIHYCFHSVDGFSKFGSYTGNGSTDGPFVYTGFRPAFLIYKRTDSADSWVLVDNKRNTYNPEYTELYPNLSNAEANDNRYIDFTANGYKIRGSSTTVNASGGTYIYMAFAEMPTKYCASMAR
jgi:hypothetical protein